MNGHRAEYYSWVVPYHQEVLRAHQSHFCLRAIAEGPGAQSDVSDIQTETKQIYQAELTEWGNCRACQRFPDVFCGNSANTLHNNNMYKGYNNHNLHNNAITSKTNLLYMG